MRKNFFGIFSAVKNRDFESREHEHLNPKLGDFFSVHNNKVIYKFVYNLLVSKFIHLINTKPSYQNRGRLDLAPERELQYSESEVRAILQLYFNREDADCSVLFLTGHSSPKGDIFLWCKEGEVPINFQVIKDLWDNRTSKHRNRELLLIVDACFSGNWAFASQQPDIFVQASCAPKEKSRDIRINDTVIGSVFLHNLLMLHGVTDCFFEGVNQTPTCSMAKPDQIDRIRNVFELDIMKRNWDDFKGGFKDKFRSFSRDAIIWEGPPPINNQVEVAVEVEKVKRGGQGLPFGGPPFGGPIGGPMGGPIGGHMGGRTVEVTEVRSSGGALGGPSYGGSGFGFGGGFDIGRTGNVTVTTSSISGGGSTTIVKEESMKRSFQSGGGGAGMMRFGMN